MKKINFLLGVAFLTSATSLYAATPKQYIEAMVKEGHKDLAIAAYNGLNEKLKKNVAIQKLIKGINNNELPKGGGASVTMPNGADAAEQFNNLFVSDDKANPANTNYGYKAAANLGYDVKISKK